jgi:hypothetical protein
LTFTITTFEWLDKSEKSDKSISIRKGAMPELFVLVSASYKDLDRKGINIAGSVSSIETKKSQLTMCAEYRMRKKGGRN